ncbi:MAG TPA: VWA domain-containing protein [Terriglobales bacterium]|nr:VWA domain-containing protein [Terriglobales bacterium]
MRKRGGKLAGVLMALSLGAWLAAQEVPDAPSATKRPEPEKQASPLPPPSEAPPAKPIPRPEIAAPESTNPQAPPMVMTTTPAGSRAEGTAGNREEMFKLSVTLNFIIVPVTVKDGSDRLVDGLLRKDFTVYEDGVMQPLKLFTSDPFPLSAAVVLDLGVPDVVMRKVNETLPSLVGAFSAYDEVSLYTFGNSVEQRLDYSVADDKFSAALKRERRPGRQGGVPVTSGPMAAGPSVNGVPFDPGAPHVSTARRESKVLNDAILAAALDLARRDRNRRKILFVISDGSEYGSRASYGEVLKVLLSHEISVYAINVDSAAIPGVRTLEGIHIPRMGYGNLLPRYASATGGQIFQEFSQDSIEQAYAKVTEVARNQYTLGYTTRATAANTYRSIEVKVRRGGLRVFAKNGYYPLPPTR